MPPASQGSPIVRVLAGQRCVRVSRDGANTGTKFVKVKQLLSSCTMGALGVLTMDAGRGSRAQFTTTSGVVATLGVSRAPDGRPTFTLRALDDDVILSSGYDARAVLRAGGAADVMQPAQAILQGPNWGLPVVSVLAPHVPLSEVAVASPQFQAFSATLVAVGEACPTDCNQFWELIVALSATTSSHAAVEELAFASASADELRRSVAADVVTRLAALCGKAVGLAMRIVTKLPSECTADASSLFAALVADREWAQASTFAA